MNLQQRIFPVLRIVTAGLCIYEAASILSRKTPTLSQLQGDYPMLGPVLITSLLIHLYHGSSWITKQAVQIALPLCDASQ